MSRVVQGLNPKLEVLTVRPLLATKKKFIFCLRGQKKPNPNAVDCKEHPVVIWAATTE